MKFRNWIAAALCTAAVAGLAPAHAQTYKPEYKLSIVVGTTFPWGQGAEIWSNLVRERTQGHINIKVYPGTSLVQGDQTREFTAIRQGVIDMAVGSTINWSPQVKQLNLFSLPFLMPTTPPSTRWCRARSAGDVQAHRESRRGAAGLGREWLPPAVELKREIKRPEDMKGMKLRVVGSPLYIDTFTALGANPTQMSWADAQPALSQRRGRRPGEPAVHLHRLQALHRGPEVPDAVELRSRPADLRGQPGGLERLVRKDRGSCARPRWTPASSRSSSRARA